MEKFDFYMTIIELGITKTKIAKKLNVKRPTLDKAIGQFIEDNKCNNPKIMILFSRLQKYEFITEKILMNEIELTSEYMNELKDRFYEMCEGKDIKTGISDLKEESLETSKVVNENAFENIEPKKLSKTIRGKSKKNPKHIVGQVVECTIVKEIDLGFLVAFDHVKGVIHFADFHELGKGHEFDKEKQYEAIITLINGTHYYLKQED